MQRHIPATDYPVEYVPYFPASDSPFFIFGTNSSLPDSANGVLHYHNLFQLGYCLSGNGVFLIENKIFPVSKGDCVIIPNNTIHSSRSIAGSECVFKFCAFSPEQLFILSQFNNSRVFELRSQKLDFFNGSAFSLSDGESHRLVRELVREAGSGDDNEHTLCAIYLSEFFVNLEHIRAEFSVEYDMRDFYIILPSIKEIMMRFSEHIDTSHLARICSLSETHFTRLFRRCCGMSPYKFIIDLRTRAGRSLLLSTDKKISDITRVTGFGSESDFYRQFVKQFGLAPSGYRMKAAKD